MKRAIDLREAYVRLVAMFPCHNNGHEAATLCVASAVKLGAVVHWRVAEGEHKLVGEVGQDLGGFFNLARVSFGNLIEVLVVAVVVEIELVHTSVVHFVEYRPAPRRPLDSECTEAGHRHVGCVAADH